MITIVSGVPRSGTSMMMQMLAAGGMPVLADNLRAADPDNPRGYLEWEEAKKLPREPQLIAAAEGKCVKVVSPLLFALPADREYQVIFMNRDLHEVAASQGAMTRRLGTVVAGLGEEVLLRGLQSHLNQVKAWLQRRSGMRVLEVQYKSALSGARVSEEICRFLQMNLDRAAMRQQVDERLYRQRAEPGRAS